MRITLLNFFYMGGYGFYVWSAYGAVVLSLGIQWLIPWRRWQRYVKQQKQYSS